MFHFHRGERRYQRKRLFQKRLTQNLNYRLMVRDYQKFPQPTILREVSKDDWAYRNAILRVNTSRLCSCWLCQSDRKTRSIRTFQERRFIERYKDID
jgi:hypothetical protein